MNTNTFSITFPENFAFYLFIYIVIWLFVFINHLKRQDYQSSDRVVWTIILTTTPVIGVLLYFLMSSQPLQRDSKSRAIATAKADTKAEARIKAACNKQA